MDNETQQALLVGASQMIASGDITLVLVDATGHITAQEGALAKPDNLMKPVTEALPFLVGLEDQMAAVAKGKAPSICLPRLAVVQPSEHGPVTTVHLFARGRDRLGIVLQDISGLVHLERQVLQQRNELALAQSAMERATREAIDANSAKSEFLMRLSQELRTPLNAILGFTDLLTSSSTDPVSAEQRGFLDDIAHSGRQVLAMVDDLLDLSRVEAGRLPIERQLIDLGLLAREVEELMEPSAHAQGIRYATNVPDGIQFTGDPRLCRQILINLVRNAIKATQPGGTVTVSADLTGDWLEIVVADTGVGMSAEEARLALAAFGPMRVGAGIGSGLGLPLTVRFVEAHGGTFALDSEPGVGTKARVSLPLRR
jgi:signal transduction histidine kinase